MEVLGIKSKHMNQFISTDIQNKGIKVIQAIIKSISDQKEKMEIDHSNEEQKQIQSTTYNLTFLKENFSLLGKAIEIIQNVYNHSSQEKLKLKIAKTCEEIVNIGQNFTFFLYIQERDSEFLRDGELLRQT